MVQELENPETLVPAINMVQLEQRLEKLVGDYRNALRIVARLPRIGRLKTTTTPSGRVRRRWVIRPFVGIFVESHIRSKLDAIAAVLSIEATELVDDSNEDSKKLKSWIKQLRALSKMLRGWKGSFTLLTKAPLLAALLPLFGAILGQLVGIDISGAAAFGSSITKLGQSAGSDSILTFLKFLAVLLLYSYILFSAVVVGFGFRGKRAIFSGGKTEPDFFNRDMFHHDKRVDEWQQIPKTNIYHVENDLFEVLRIKKPTEFPLDIVASFTPYFVLVVAIIFAARLVITLRTGQLPSIWQFLSLLVFLFLLFNYVYSSVSYYRDRIRDKVV